MVPLFEYRCKKCGYVTVFLEKAGSRGRHVCEECGRDDTEKLFSTFAARAGTTGSCRDSACPATTCPLSKTCPGSACEDRPA
ncbi:MAG: FmdB family zinc ribbon protein [Planctomycetota bacterium]